jgi:hypothetical protein
MTMKVVGRSVRTIFWSNGRTRRVTLAANLDIVQGTICSIAISKSLQMRSETRELLEVVVCMIVAALIVLVI